MDPEAEVREVESRGHRISYLVAGAGPPVLLLCGLSQWADQWFEHGYGATLAQTHRVVAVDRLGHGRSDKPHDPARYDTSGLVEDLLGVLDAEQVHRAAVWGFSMGSHDGAALAVAHPDRVDALVYGSGPSLTTSPDEHRIRNAGLGELLRSPDGLRVLWAALGFTDERAVLDGLARNDAEALACAVDGGLVSFATAAEIATPSLWYRGEGEGGFDDKERECAAARGVELHVVQDADHFGTFLRSEEVLDFVAPFLDGHR